MAFPQIDIPSAGPLTVADLDAARKHSTGRVMFLHRAVVMPAGLDQQGRYETRQRLPWPDTEETDYSELERLASCAPEGGRHADPVAAPRFSKSAPYINAILLTAGYLWEERRPFVYVALAEVLAVVGYGFRVFVPL